MDLQFLYNIMSVAFLLGLGFDLLHLWRRHRELDAEVSRLRKLEAAGERVGGDVGRALEAEQRLGRELRERLGKGGVL